MKNQFTALLVHCAEITYADADISLSTTELKFEAITASIIARVYPIRGQMNSAKNASVTLKYSWYQIK